MMMAIAAVLSMGTCRADTENKMNEKYDEADLRRRFDSMGPAHPRLCTRTDVLPADMGDREPFIQALIVEARALETVPVLERIQEGRRLLRVSREALRRLSVLSIAWMRTRDEGFLKRAEAEMLAVCAFSDWNTSHYLDTAEMSLAVALGYDWLYNALPVESREKIAEGLWRLGLQTALDDTQGWVKAHNNWGQVCHAGMTAAALALAEKHPDEAFKVVERASRNIRIPMEAYAPDGVYPEGPMYWDYGTSFNIAFFILVESALGTSYDLDDMPGFVDSADFMRHATAPSGYYFNYADCRSGRRCDPGLLWFADRFKCRFGGGASGAFEREWTAVVKTPAQLMRDRLAPLIVTFGLEDKAALPADAKAIPLDMHGRGVSELVMMRSAWNDPAAWYVGVKAGTPSAPHGHMDGGSFIVEAGGVRWGLECGMEDYNRLEQMGYNLWGAKQDGPRWDVFKYGNLSHNIIVINGERQHVAGSARVVSADLNVSTPDVKVSLSELYGRSVMREFNFTKRESLTITDTFSGLSVGDAVRWQMLTEAKATSRGGVLTLAKDGKTLTLAVDADVEWKVTEARDLYKAWDSPQENLRVVSFERKAAADGGLSHAVTFRLADRRKF